MSKIVVTCFYSFIHGGSITDAIGPQVTIYIPNCIFKCNWTALVH